MIQCNKEYYEEKKLSSFWNFFLSLCKGKSEICKAAWEQYAYILHSGCCWPDETKAMCPCWEAGKTHYEKW